MTDPREGRRSEASRASSPEPPRSTVLLSPIDPCCVWVWWQVDPREVDAARLRSRARPAGIVLRLEPAAAADDGGAALAAIDLDVGSPQGNYYARLPRPGLTVTAELGVRGAAGELEPILRSNTVTLARGSESSRYQPSSRRVGGAGDPLWQPRRRPPPLPWTPAEAAAAEDDAVRGALAAAAAPGPRAADGPAAPGAPAAAAPAALPACSSFGAGRLPPAVSSGVEARKP